MTSQANNTVLSPLYAEHLALGARFGEGGIVSAYAGQDCADEEQSTTGTFLSDVSSVPAWVLHGDAAPDFAQAAFAGRKLEQGECAFEASLTGDGSLTSIPLLTRTGIYEYALFDFGRRAEVLLAWLQFLQAASKDGYAPYESVHLQDATASHVLLALWGDDATRVLSDYAKQEPLPTHAHIASCHLDKIPCIVVCLPATRTSCYLVLVPPAFATALWRSLLSFTEVTPQGMPAFRRMLAQERPYLDTLDATDVLRIPAKELLAHGIVRQNGDFVGARGLFANQEGSVRR